MQRKLKAAQSSSYAKAISDVERRVKKQLRSKAKSLIDLLCQWENKRTVKRKKAKHKH